VAEASINLLFLYTGCFPSAGDEKVGLLTDVLSISPL